jgi:hypothetical protein
VFLGERGLANRLRLVALSVWFGGAEGVVCYGPHPILGFRFKPCGPAQRHAPVSGVDQLGFRARRRKRITGHPVRPERAPVHAAPAHTHQPGTADGIGL